MNSFFMWADVPTCIILVYVQPQLITHEYSLIKQWGHAFFIPRGVLNESES